MRFRPYLLILWTLALVLASASGVGFTIEVLGAVVGTPFILLLCFLWPRKWSLRWQIPSLYAVPFCLVAVTSIWATHWPLKLHYMASRQSLNRTADRVEAKESLALPQQVGLIRIVEAEVYWNGITCLWTSNDPGGHAGFVRTPQDKVRFNLWSLINLDDEWQFIEED